MSNHRTEAGKILDRLYDTIAEQEQQLIESYMKTTELVGINLADRLGQLRATVVRQLSLNYGLSQPEISKMMQMRRKEVERILGRSNEYNVLGE